MIISELIEILEEAAMQIGDDAEVRLATQPNWPFEHRISDRTAVADGALYLAESGQVGYLSGVVSQELGWI